MCSAHRTVRVRRALHRVELHIQAVEEQHPPRQGLADPQQAFDHLQRLDAPQHPDGRAHHPHLGAALAAVFRHRAHQAAQTGALAGHIGHGLSGEPDDPGVHIGLLLQHAGVVDEELRGKPVRGVHHGVVLRDDLLRVVRRQLRPVEHHLHIRVDRLDRLLRADDFLLPHCAGIVDDLPLEIGEIHGVVIHDAQGAYPGGRQIQQSRRSQAPRAHHQHFGRKELFLPGHAHPGQHEMPGVPYQLFLGKCHSDRPFPGKFPLSRPAGGGKAE